MRLLVSRIKASIATSTLRPRSTGGATARRRLFGRIPARNTNRALCLIIHGQLVEKEPYDQKPHPALPRRLGQSFPTKDSGLTHEYADGVIGFSIVERSARGGSAFYTFRVDRGILRCFYFCDGHDRQAYLKPSGPGHRATRCVADNGFEKTRQAQYDCLTTLPRIWGNVRCSGDSARATKLAR
jgi:hypothetical protein